MYKTLGEKYDHAFAEKNSVLCIGLDPALPSQRSNNTIPETYLQDLNDSNARLHFCLDLLKQTASFCIAAKPNEQYLRGFSAKQHQILTKHIRDYGLLSIYDCKLGDIRDSAESAIFHISKWGYDALTVNPFAGNLEEMVKIAGSARPSVGLIVLTLMSNPEAEKFMRQATISGDSLYVTIAKDVKKYGAAGCVVGATGHVTWDDITRIRKEAGDDKILLIPGVGTQRGDPEKVIKAGGKKILINVGRDVIYSTDPKHEAQKYCHLFNAFR